MRKLEIENAQGVCKNEKFQSMLDKGLLVSEKVDEHLNETLELVGSCKANIKTDDKEFSLYYYVTKSGLIISSGSEYLFQSLNNVEFGKDVVLKKVKTKRGFTYVFNPIFDMSEIIGTTDDELPF